MRTDKAIAADWDTTDTIEKPPQTIGMLQFQVLRTESIPILENGDKPFGHVIEEQLALRAKAGEDVQTVTIQISPTMWQQMGGRTSRTEW